MKNQNKGKPVTNRYFFFSAMYKEKWRLGISTQNFGVVLTKFPNMRILKDEVIRANKDANEITILAVCELSKEGYETIWEDDY